jgi:nucleoside-diphosphate-sugar epimerase
LRWIAGGLPNDVAAVPAAATIFSLGPLDAFAEWFATHGANDARVIAIGSRSIDTKKDSADASERDVAARLARAEASLDRSGAHVTVLRPTLIYGAGLDRSLTPIVAFARRWRLFPYVAGAHGLRQPVHADDLASACIALAHTMPQRRVYDVGGDERIAFSEMLRRVRASLPFGALALPVPLAIANAGAGLARLSPAFRAASAGALARMREDLVTDHAAAVADFGWSPRAFHPEPRDWTPPPLP